MTDLKEHLVKLALQFSERDFPVFIALIGFQHCLHHVEGKTVVVRACAMIEPLVLSRTHPDSQLPLPQCPASTE